jgi:hypothetical protein
LSEQRGIATVRTMRIRFIKGSVSSRHDLLVCLRPDGSETRGDMPRQGILPHDAIHFVVEQTLGWNEAFFGHVARGAELGHVTTRLQGEKVDWSQATQALQSESLVECLQAEQWGGAATPELFAQTLAESCRHRGVAAPALTRESLAAVRAALRTFGAAWRPLGPGGVLERNWP